MKIKNGFKPHNTDKYCLFKKWINAHSKQKDTRSRVNAPIGDSLRDVWTLKIY